MWPTITFQSTHPARGATRLRYRPGQRHSISIHAPREGCDACFVSFFVAPFGHFNPRTPRGVRRYVVIPIRLTAGISIHAPREGCDVSNPEALIRWLEQFQSTHPARGATGRTVKRDFPIVISIHAPREGCDGGLPGGCGAGENFNPRTPRGVRRYRPNTG